MSQEEKKILRLRDYEQNRTNPFIEDAIQEVQKHTIKKWKNASTTDKKAILTAVNDDGEPVGFTRFLRQVEVDEERFTKLFLSNFSAFFDLKPPAIKVFSYIMEQLIPNKDEFIFVLEDCMEHTGYKSHKSVNQGLRELLKAKIIARGRTDFYYYINPMVAFNGDRLQFATEYIKVKKELLK